MGGGHFLCMPQSQGSSPLVSGLCPSQVFFPSPCVVVGTTHISALLPGAESSALTFPCPNWCLSTSALEVVEFVVISSTGKSIFFLLWEIREMHGLKILIPCTWVMFFSPRSAFQWSILRALSDLFWKWKHPGERACERVRTPSVSEALRGFTLTFTDSSVLLAELLLLVFVSLLQVSESSHSLSSYRLCLPDVGQVFCSATSTPQHVRKHSWIMHLKLVWLVFLLTMGMFLPVYCIPGWKLSPGWWLLDFFDP